MLQAFYMSKQHLFKKVCHVFFVYGLIPIQIRHSHNKPGLAGFYYLKTTAHSTEM
jgi:hypothetical protein